MYCHVRLFRKILKVVAMINNRIILYSLFVVSSSTLCFEILATRITSVIFVNHFAFIIISLAILGLSLGAIFAHYYFDKRKPTSLVSSLSKNLIILSISSSDICAMIKLTWLRFFRNRSALILGTFGTPFSVWGPTLTK